MLYLCVILGRLVLSVYFLCIICYCGVIVVSVVTFNIRFGIWGNYSILLHRLCILVGCLVSDCCYFLICSWAFLGILLYSVVMLWYSWYSSGIVLVFFGSVLVFLVISGTFIVYYLCIGCVFLGIL